MVELVECRIVESSNGRVGELSNGGMMELVEFSNGRIVESSNGGVARVIESSIGAGNGGVGGVFEWSSRRIVEWWSCWSCRIV